MAEGGNVVVKFGANTSGFEKGVKRAAKALVALLIVKKIGDAFVGAAKKAAAFEKGMAEVSTLSNFTTKQMKQMSAETLKFSVKMNQSVEKLAKARYDTVSAGFSSVSAQTKVLGAAAKLAVAGVTDVATTTDILTSVLNAYGLEADNANRVSDILFTTVKQGKTTMEQINASFGNILPAARNAGISIEEVGASFASLTAAGIKPAEAATSLRSAFDKLIAPTKASAKAMKKAGIDIVDASGGLIRFDEVIQQFEGLSPAKLAELIPSEEARKAILSLMNDTAGLTENIDNQINNATGATNAAFETMSNTVDFQLGQLGKRWDAFWIGVGSGKQGEALKGALGLVSKTLDDNKKGVEDFQKALSELSAGAISTVLIPATLVLIESITRLNKLINETGRAGNELDMLGQDMKNLGAEVGREKTKFDDLTKTIQNTARLTGQSFEDVERQVKGMAGATTSTMDIALSGGKAIGESMIRVANEMEQSALKLKSNTELAASAMQSNFEETSISTAATWSGVMKGMEARAGELESTAGADAASIKNEFATNASSMATTFGGKVNTMEQALDTWLNTQVTKVINVKVKASFSGPPQGALGGLVLDKTIKLAQGGSVGTDTVPAMLTPGEIVIRKSVAQANKQMLLNLNKTGSFMYGGLVEGYSGGGTVQVFQGGGQVQGFQEGGLVESGIFATPGTLGSFLPEDISQQAFEQAQEVFVITQDMNAAIRAGQEAHNAEMALLAQEIAEEQISSVTDASREIINEIIELNDLTRKEAKNFREIMKEFVPEEQGIDPFIGLDQETLALAKELNDELFQSNLDRVNKITALDMRAKEEAKARADEFQMLMLQGQAEFDQAQVDAQEALTEKLIEFATLASQGMQAGFEAGFTAIITGQGTFLAAFAAGMRDMLVQVINLAVAQVVAEKIKNIAIAIISGQATFGASLAQIPIILAAAGAATAGLKAINFQEGGEVPGRFTGPARDVVPARLTPGENVLTGGLSERLEEFLDSGGGPETVELVVDSEVLATAVLRNEKIARRSL